MCYQSLISDACVHAYIKVQNICPLIRLAYKANRAGGWERAGFAGKRLHNIPVLKCIYGQLLSGVLFYF
jgi:metal-dependent HD superfamily phosphatase/phosphodiesterase